MALLELCLLGPDLQRLTGKMNSPKRFSGIALQEEKQISKQKIRM